LAPVIRAVCCGAVVIGLPLWSLTVCDQLTAVHAGKGKTAVI
jgi:hypothetical protein